MFNVFSKLYIGGYSKSKRFIFLAHFNCKKCKNSEKFSVRDSSIPNSSSISTHLSGEEEKELLAKKKKTTIHSSHQKS